MVTPSPAAAARRKIQDLSDRTGREYFLYYSNKLKRPEDGGFFSRLFRFNPAKKRTKKSARRNPRPALATELASLIRQGKSAVVSPGGVRKGKLMARIKVKK